MSTIESSTPRTRCTFSLRQLLTGVAIFAAMSALVGYTQSMGLGLMVLASFLGVLGLGCLVGVNSLKGDNRPPYQWVFNALGLVGSLLNIVDAIVLSAGILSLVEEVLRTRL